MFHCGVIDERARRARRSARGRRSSAASSSGRRCASCRPRRPSSGGGGVRPSTAGGRSARPRARIPRSRSAGPATPGPGPGRGAFRPRRGPLRPPRPWPGTRGASCRADRVSACCSRSRSRSLVRAQAEDLGALLELAEHLVQWSVPALGLGVRGDESAEHARGPRIRHAPREAIWVEPRAWTHLGDRERANPSCGAENRSRLPGSSGQGGD